jgi:hypothetical protein
VDRALITLPLEPLGVQAIPEARQAVARRRIHLSSRLSVAAGKGSESVSISSQSPEAFLEFLGNECI